MTTKAAAATKVTDTPKPEAASQPAPVQASDPAPAGQPQTVKLTQAQAMELQTRQWGISFELYRMIYRHEMKPEEVTERFKAARAAVFSSGAGAA